MKTQLEKEEIRRLIGVYGKFKEYREMLKKPLRPFIDGKQDTKDEMGKQLRELFGEEMDE
jgi:hypothetical protein